MANGSEKKWNRPWSMEEMIENSENWSMAGDVALLNTLKAFSENLFKRTGSLSDNVDNLLHDLDDVGLKLNLSQNEFQSLRNTQFIESRVYEDDETLEFVEEDNKPKQKVVSEEEKEKLMRESVVEGLRVMDKYFEKIEVSISDSEDEESDRSYVLRPIDLYEDRPLPLVIGTEEWYKKWHVGLADSSSETESEKVSETYSESDSGDDLPKDLIKGSETSSDLDLSSQTSENRPVANSTFNETSKRPNALASDEESDGQGSLPVKTPISSKSFAEQLAAKLGDVISEREDISSEINRNPIQPAQRSKFADVLFSDEPPPLDDLEDTVLPKSAQEGLFSGGRGLFDDNEDDLFWGQQGKAPSVNPPGETSDVKRESGEETSKIVAALPKTSQVRKGPFDSDTESSDEDIFSVKPKKLAKQPFLQPYSTTAPLFDEEPPELEASKKATEEALKKKPIGGVSIFGKPDIFSGEKVSDILKSRHQDSIGGGKAGDTVADVSSQSVAPSGENTEKPKHRNLFDEDEDRVVETPPAPADRKPHKISLFDNDESKPEPSVKPKKTSLFDDVDDLFKDDLFSSVTAKKLTSNLFDDIEENTEDIFAANVNKTADLFGDFAGAKRSPTEEKTVQKPKKKLDLFDSDNEAEDLFAVGKTVSSSVESNPTVDGKEDAKLSDQAVSVNDDEVDKSFVITEKVEELPSRQVIGAENFVGEKKTTKSLFDDSLEEEEDTEDIFKGLDVKKTQLADDLFGEVQPSGTGKSTLATQRDAEVERKDASLEVTDSKQVEPKAKEKTQSQSTINLFGSSPPPDDDDWDAKSAPSSDNDDQFSYRVDYNAARSSLFDNEPPSLGPNDSSGIVRDENVTRVDADDSSFYPYASSSRRHSSDIFNEQQSQDSFFVTKNKSESVGAPLDKIPEAEKSSNLDVTPSGRIEDFEDSTDSSLAVGDSSVFKKSVQNEPTTSSKKTVSLFDDELDTSTDTDDLFSSISKRDAMPRLSEKRLSLFDNMDDVLEVAAKNSSVKEKSEPAKVEAPQKEEKADFAKESEKETVKTAEVDRKDLKKSPTVSPGKLKHNLKINVAALLPGAAPPKSREFSKSHSLDLPKEQEVTPTDLSSPEMGFFTPTISSPPRNVSSGSSEKAVSFEDALDNVEVLHSVTKDRARIPIKRRPSTRRGRHQAIKSGDFTLAGGDNATLDPSTPVEHGPPKPKDLPDLTPSPLEVKTPEFKTPMSETGQSTADFKDKDDAFLPKPSGEPIVALHEKKAAVDAEIVTKPLSQTATQSFLDEKSAGGATEDDDLFGKSSSTDFFDAEKPKGSIFESDDSDSELFGQKGAKAEVSGKKGAAAKKSLFNDSSSDEDLFAASGGGSSRRRENVRKVSERKPPKVATTRKLENIETDEDPLSSLLK